MKKLIFISVFTIIFILVLNVNVSARSSNEQWTSDPEKVNDSTQERYVINTTAVEQSVILYKQVIHQQ